MYLLFALAPPYFYVKIFLRAINALLRPLSCYIAVLLKIKLEITEITVGLPA